MDVQCSSSAPASSPVCARHPLTLHCIRSTQARTSSAFPFSYLMWYLSAIHLHAKAVCSVTYFVSTWCCNDSFLCGVERPCPHFIIHSTQSPGMVFLLLRPEHTKDEKWSKTVKLQRDSSNHLIPAHAGIGKFGFGDQCHGLLR